MYQVICFILWSCFIFSAVLAAGAPKHAAFMADESMQVIPGLQVIKYDLPFYKGYMKEVMKIVQQLNKEGTVIFKSEMQFLNIDTSILQVCSSMEV